MEGCLRLILVIAMFVAAYYVVLLLLPLAAVCIAMAIPIWLISHLFKLDAELTDREFYFVLIGTAIFAVLMAILGLGVLKLLCYIKFFSTRVNYNLIGPDFPTDPSTLLIVIGYLLAGAVITTFVIFVMRTTTSRLTQVAILAVPLIIVTWSLSNFYNNRMELWKLYEDNNITGIELTTTVVSERNITLVLQNSTLSPAYVSFSVYKDQNEKENFLKWPKEGEYYCPPGTCQLNIPIPDSTSIEGLLAKTWDVYLYQNVDRNWPYGHLYKYGGSNKIIRPILHVNFFTAEDYWERKEVGVANFR